MKKSIIFIIIILLISLTGCQNTTDNDNTSPIAGEYLSQPDSEARRIEPYLKLYGNYEFHLMDDVINSEQIIGSYEILDNYVILNHSYKPEVYKFEISGDTMIYIENENNKLDNIADRTIFYLYDQ
jgi:hypothetical protein